MSDAIVLDVLSASPVQLDVGDADPIAREEIAALAGRVTTVEGDVSGLSTRMGAVEGDISTLGTTVDGIDARVEAIEADYVTSEDVMGALGGEAPTLVAGSSRAVLGDPETASWMQRTTAADGAALIEAVYGNTVVQDGSLLPVRMEGVETVAADESWSSQLAIPASTYFPDGMRSAGTVRDELTSTESITRVEELTGEASEGWFIANNGVNTHGIAYIQRSMPCISTDFIIGNTFFESNIEKQTTLWADSTSRGIASNGTTLFYRFPSSYPATLEAGLADMKNVDAKTHVPLDTPVTTPIDPPLPLSYRTGAGGTERVMVASGTTSAPPVFVTRYPLDPADLAASIAPRESATAEANHAVGDLIMLGWTLCKVTTAIARGESITIGTNVTKTSVSAELAALS